MSVLFLLLLVNRGGGGVGFSGGDFDSLQIMERGESKGNPTGSRHFSTPEEMREYFCLPSTVYVN